MPTDWLSGDNPTVLITCLLTVGVATAVMYVSAELGGRSRRLVSEAGTAAGAIETNPPHEQAA